MFFYRNRTLPELSALVKRTFKGHDASMKDNYLSLSFSDITTYADKVQRAVSRVKRNANAKKLVWLLERGVTFDGSAYITESQFTEKYRGKRKILPHLGLNQFVKNTEMVRLVPIQAPRNYTADITLRKGSAADTALPVLFRKTDLESDYPYLTKELAIAIGKSRNWVARSVTVLSLKGDPNYHQAIRASSSSVVHRYSQAALDALQKKLAAQPDFDPYHPV